MIEYIALIAVLGLVVSNILLIRIAFKTKLLDKAETVFDYTAVTETRKAPEIQSKAPIEVPIY